MIQTGVERTCKPIRWQAPEGSGKFNLRTDACRASRTSHVSVYTQRVYPD
jgi:hypothetical protein